MLPVTIGGVGSIRERKELDLSGSGRLAIYDMVSGS